MLKITHKRLTTGILGLSLAIVLLAGQVSAQATNDAAPDGTTTVTGTTTGTGTDAMPGTGANPGMNTGVAMPAAPVVEDEGFNPGWLGLLGLAGLAGLMPKKTQTVTTTHRTGDGTAR